MDILKWIFRPKLLFTYTTAYLKVWFFNYTECNIGIRDYLFVKYIVENVQN